jgi:hypothetical protein
VAFLRFTRDKRCVENFYLVQPTTNRRGKVRARVLYWFRSPPDVKVGRAPFDAEVRRTLEAQNPGVEFDWRAIVDTPIPSADADKWRERRRADRAAKHAAAEDAAKQAAAEDGETPDASDGETLPADIGAPSATLIDQVGSSVFAAPSSSDTRPSSLDRDRRSRRRRRSGGRRDNNPHVTPPPSDPTTEPSGD